MITSRSLAVTCMIFITSPLNSFERLHLPRPTRIRHSLLDKLWEANNDFLGPRPDRSDSAPIQTGPETYSGGTHFERLMGGALNKVKQNRAYNIGQSFQEQNGLTSPSAVSKTNAESRTRLSEGLQLKKKLIDVRSFCLRGCHAFTRYFRPQQRSRR